jgi:hypothetical protein
MCAPSRIVFGRALSKDLSCSWVSLRLMACYYLLREEEVMGRLTLDGSLLIVGLWRFE